MISESVMRLFWSSEWETSHTSEKKELNLSILTDWKALSLTLCIDPLKDLNIDLSIKFKTKFKHQIIKMNIFKYELKKFGILLN